MAIVQFNFCDVNSVPHMTRLNYRNSVNTVFNGSANDPDFVDENPSLYSKGRIFSCNEVGDYLQYTPRMVDYYSLLIPVPSPYVANTLGPDLPSDDVPDGSILPAYEIKKFFAYRLQLPDFMQGLHYETMIRGQDYIGITSGSPLSFDWSDAYTTGITMFVKQILSGPSAGAGSGSSDFADPVANANATSSRLNSSGVINTDQSIESSFLSTSSGEFEFAAAGAKYFHRFENDSYLVPTQISVDASGCISRSIRDGRFKSPAGQDRGEIKKAEYVKPIPTNDKIEDLYNNRINFVKYEEDLEKYILFGDKTRKEETSTFSRINVSLLFIKLKKLIGKAIRDILFDQNDSITRSKVSTAINQILRKISADGGISEYQITCDESNNTPDIIDSNQLIVDVSVKPTKSINFIKIRFTNTENI